MIKIIYISLSSFVASCNHKAEPSLKTMEAKVKPIKAVQYVEISDNTLNKLREREAFIKLLGESQFAIGNSWGMPNDYIYSMDSWAVSKNNVLGTLKVTFSRKRNSAKKWLVKDREFIPNPEVPETNN